MENETIENDNIHLRKEPCAECGAPTWYHDLVERPPQCYKCHIKEFVKQPKPSWCICSDAFWQRGRYDPACRHDELQNLYDKIEKLTEEN